MGRTRTTTQVIPALVGLAMVLGHKGPPAVAAPSQEPDPTVTLTAPAVVKIGMPFGVDVGFANAGVIGYGPFLDVVLDWGGEDLNAAGERCDGLRLNGAPALSSPPGLALPPHFQSAAIDNCSSQPITIPHLYKDNGVADVTLPPGAQLITIELPFGNFDATMPDATVHLPLWLSDFADRGKPRWIRARAGFRFGNDGSNAPGNTPIFSAGDSSGSAATWSELKQVTPVLVTLGKAYESTENENATGPNTAGQYDYKWDMSVDLAPGQEITDLVLEDIVPDTMVYTGTTTDPVVSASAISPPPPKQGAVTVQVAFGDVTGAAKAPDLQAWLHFYTPGNHNDGDPMTDDPPILGPDCDWVANKNTVHVTGLWDPLDPRDDEEPVDVTYTTPVAPLPALWNKCLAVQKSVAIVADTGTPGLTPGDTLQYSLAFQVSDYFTLGDIALTDHLGDGQTTVGDMTMTVSDRFGVTTADPATLLAEVTTVPDETYLCQGVTGGERLTFPVSTIMKKTAGAPARHALGILTGGHAFLPYSGTPAIGTLTFKAVVGEEYTYNGLDEPGNANIDKHDPIANCLDGTSKVYTNTAMDAALQLTGHQALDGSASLLSVVPDSLTKRIFARNGVELPAGGGLPQFAAGDVITYRVQKVIPSGDGERVTIQDWLPLPVVPVPAVPPTKLAGKCIGIPQAGQLCFEGGTPSTFTPGLPTWQTDQATNSLIVNLGSYLDIQNKPLSMVLLYSFVITADPYPDGMHLANVVSECEYNSFNQKFCQSVGAEFVLTEPALRVWKGVVATTAMAGTHHFQPNIIPAGQPWQAPGSSPGGPACTARFTAPITSQKLASNPIDNDLYGADGGDKVTFAIVVQNLGKGLHGAFDVTVKDTLMPAPTPGLQIDWSSLCVTDGTGATLLYDPVNAADPYPFWAQGIILRDPGPTAAPPGALDPAHPTSGRDLAVITFDATLAEQIQPACYRNLAEILHYAAVEQGADFKAAGFGGPFVDDARVCPGPTVAKSIVATSEKHTTPETSGDGGVPELAIGELVMYQLKVTVPEGHTKGLRIVESLPKDIAYVDASAKFVSLSAPAVQANPGQLTVLNGNHNCYGLPGSPTFDFGDVTNTPVNNGQQEYLVMSFVGQVCNDAYNNQGETKTNSATVVTSEASFGTGAVDAKIVEPEIKITKVNDISPQIGAPFMFTIDVESVGATTAFDVRVQDLLPKCFGSVDGVSIDVLKDDVGDFQDNSSGKTLDVWIEAMPPGALVRIQLDTSVTCLDCADLVNTAKVVWTSLPGEQGSTANPTGWPTAGQAGKPDGERTGSDDITDVNDYVKSSTVNMCGMICGMKYHDLNGNGVKDNDEVNQGLANWTIQVDGPAKHTLSTDADGKYCTPLTLAGVYSVGELQQAGWQQTAPPGGKHSFLLHVGETKNEVDFGNWQPGPPACGPADNLKAGPVWGFGTDGFGETGPNPTGPQPHITAGAFDEVSAGGTHGVAIRDDGTLLAWGEDIGPAGAGSVSGPNGSPPQKYVASLSAGGFAAGHHFTVAIRSPGFQLDCWPATGLSCQDLPTDPYAAQVHAGFDPGGNLPAQGLVIITKGLGSWQVRCWPAAAPGCVDTPTTANLRTVSAGNGFSAGLEHNDPSLPNILVWGANAAGVSPPPDQHAWDLAAGQDFVVAANNKRLWCWPKTHAVCQKPPPGTVTTPPGKNYVQVELAESVHQLSAGTDHFLVLSASGSLWIGGTVSNAPASTAKFVQIDAGGWFSEANFGLAIGCVPPAPAAGLVYLPGVNIGRPILVPVPQPPATATATRAATSTPSPTRTASPTGTATMTAAPTFTATASRTPLPPPVTDTATVTPSPTRTPAISGIIRTERGCTEDPAAVSYRTGETVPISLRVDRVSQATVRVLYQWPAGGQERQIDGGTINGGANYSVSPPLVIPADAPVGARRLSLQALRADQSYGEIGHCGFDVVAGGGATPTRTPTRTTPPAPQCLPLAALPNLVAWWKLDERGGEVVADSILKPLANHGMVYGLPATWGAGKVAGALSFNGSSTYVQVADHDSLDMGASPGGDFTLDLWLKLPANANTTGVHVLINKQAVSGGSGYQLYLYNAQPSLQLADGGGFTNFGAGLAIPKDDQWHLLAVTVDRDQAAGGRFYLDGAPLGTPFNPGTRPGSLANASVLRLGSASFAVTSLFHGWLDEVEVIQSALGAGEIARLYSAGTLGKCTPTPPPTVTPRSTIPPLR